MSDDPHAITTEAELVALLGTPKPLVRQKIRPRLNALTRQFVEASPLVCLATTDAEGRVDVSPRGDPRGFVQILDDATLFLPERPGNKLADSLRNLLQRPSVGLLFVIPGVGDTFRVNGRARITTDPDLCARCAVEGKVPKLGIVVHIEEAYTQCSKAFLRGRVWEPDTFVDRSTLPTSGELHRSFADEPFDAEAYDAERAERYARREGFY